MKINKQYVAGLLGLMMTSTLAFGQMGVKEIIISSGGSWESGCGNTCMDYVTMSSYNTATGVNTVFDEIKTQSTNDVIVDDANEFAYVAASDSIVKYDLSDYSRVSAIAASSMQRMAIFGTSLLVTNGNYNGDPFVTSYNTSDLSFDAGISGITGAAK
ncbi:MAG: hypothetical protein HRT72_05805, partial [Flavobacteriales bacterium]|nr:hypothetical protein [Flavobacteriales bacterium]